MERTSLSGSVLLVNISREICEQPNGSHRSRERIVIEGPESFK
jgi:hypothetical protein